MRQTPCKRTNFNLIKIVLILLCLSKSASSAYKAHSIYSYIARQNKELIEEIDEIVNSDENEQDSTVAIEESKQDQYIKEEQEKCITKMMHYTQNATTCPYAWDLIMCWPPTPLNGTTYLQCPDYINKFNQRNKAFKHCLINPNNSKPAWSLTNYSLCLLPSEEFIETIEESSIIEGHMKKIIILRICGYVASMITLTLSIIILLRPRLRCPRNFIHINLFVAFAVRTILVILLDVMLRSEGTQYVPSSNVTAKTDNDTNAEEFFDQVEESNIGCKVLMSIYRYSGSVYHVAIFAEAFYLVLLLKFPYYNEKKGCKFSILTTWTLPGLWMIPWIFFKVYDDDLWCWQTETNWNLLIKIPHSLLLTSNIFCAAIILRILYSKMQYRNMSREKLIKYRRLAKSILIIIPIFGLHFIIFAWIPYAATLDINPNIEIVTVYVETFFNAFQGFVVSIACCFIHREVRIECLLLACKLLKKIKCFRSCRCMEFLDSDYIRQLRYKYSENRNTSISIVTINNTTNNNHKNRNVSQPLIRNCSEIRFEEIQTSTPPTSASLPVKSNRKKTASSSSQNSTNLNPAINSETWTRKVCCCLFGNQKNDFYQPVHPKRKSNSNSKYAKNQNNTTDYAPADQIIETKLEKEDSSSKNETKQSNSKKVRLQLHDEPKLEQPQSELATNLDRIVFNLKEDDNHLMNSSFSDKFNSDSDYIDLSYKSNDLSDAKQKNTNEITPESK